MLDTESTLLHTIVRAPARWLSYVPFLPFPLHPQGHILVGGLLWLTILLLIFSHGLLALLAFVGAAAIYCFFRDPLRLPPCDAGIVISPADGVVTHVDTATIPKEMTAHFGNKRDGYQRVSIFLSVLDCHVVRSPVDARVHTMIWRDGLFLDARSEQASHGNTRCHMLLHANNPDQPFGVTMISGKIARRIVPSVFNQNSVRAGDEIGFIRFGSRVDVVIPNGWDICVKKGQKVIGGQSVLGSMPTNQTHGQ